MRRYVKERIYVRILRWPREFFPQAHQPKSPSTLDLWDTPRKHPESQSTICYSGKWWTAVCFVLIWWCYHCYYEINGFKEQCPLGRIYWWVVSRSCKLLRRFSSDERLKNHIAVLTTEIGKSHSRLTAVFQLQKRFQPILVQLPEPIVHLRILQVSVKDSKRQPRQCWDKKLNKSSVEMN